MPKKSARTHSTVARSAVTYNAAVAERAFADTALWRARVVDAVVPALELPQAAAIALNAWSEMQQPQRAERFALLHESLLSPELRARLAPAAWALWYASVRRATAEANATNARVPVELVANATETKTRMMRVVEYALGDHPQASIEIAGIRVGTGHFDLAMDLSRLAVLYDTYAAELAEAGLHYRSGDRELAHSLSGELLRELGSSGSPAAVSARDDAARAFRVLEDTYDTLRRWSLAMFDDTERWMPSLYAMRSTRRAARARPDTPDAPPNDTDLSETPTSTT
jgi:hypothetical protein